MGEMLISTVERSIHVENILGVGSALDACTSRISNRDPFKRPSCQSTLNGQGIDLALAEPRSLLRHQCTRGEMEILGK